MIKTEKTVIIIGVGRCGSSLVSGIVHRLGIPMGKRMIAPDEYNPRGYFEDTTIMGLQDKILASIRRSWWNPPNVINEFIRADAHIIQSLRKVIASRNEEYQVWGFKDPRTHFVLSGITYKGSIINPHYIYVHRDPYAIAKSVFKRDKGTVGNLKTALDIVKRHYYQVLDFSRENDVHPHLHVSYNEVVDDPVYEISRICRFLQLSPNADTLANAVDLVDPSIRNYK